VPEEEETGNDAQDAVQRDLGGEARCELAVDPLLALPPLHPSALAVHLAEVPAAFRAAQVTGSAV
jgi:hypothetical protein